MESLKPPPNPIFQALLQLTRSRTSSMEVDDFQTKTRAFTSWLSEMGIRMSPKMELKDLRSVGRGRGVVAVDNFDEDEVIFSIPRTTVLNVKNAIGNRGEDVPSGFEAALASMPPYLALTTIILFENSQTAKQSQWIPYLDILPRQLDSLVFWSASELSQLQASAVLNKIAKANADEMFLKHIGPLGLGTQSNECHKIASTIMAYAFDIPEAPVDDFSSRGPQDDGDDLVSDDGENQKSILSMIPLADMLNADANRNNARLSCDNEDLEMRSIVPIAKGEEILNDYGQLPRSDLLRRYGYITHNYAPYDVTEIWTDNIIAAFSTGKILSFLGAARLVPLNDAEIDRRVELAQREGVYDNSYDIRYTDSDSPSIPDELVALLFLLLVSDECLKVISNSEASLPSRSKMMTQLLGQVLVALLRLREQEFSTTLEEDENLLLQAKKSSPRTQMAIHVRLGEKQVLREAIDQASRFAGDNKRMRIAQEGQRKRDADERDYSKKKRTI